MDYIRLGLEKCLEDEPRPRILATADKEGEQG